MYLLIVTGLSGAGKSGTLTALEDRDFFCIDNLPSELLGSFAKLCIENPNIEKAAVAVDARGYLINRNEVLDFTQLDELGVRYEVLFLDCRDDVISRRYQETRRQHPLSTDISDGIRHEREFLCNVRDKASYIIDTSDLKPKDMRAELDKILNISEVRPFTLYITSFGYKLGIPTDADFIFDMRFLLNPYHEPELRMFSGLDSCIAEYIKRDASSDVFLNRVEELLRTLIPKFIEQDKRRLMVAFGCTGGRHRSVYAANAMYERLKNEFKTMIVHRDMSDWLPDYRR